jgi:CheY-like chemotaxis protein
MLGGDLSVASVPGKGSTFSFTIEAAPPTEVGLLDPSDMSTYRRQATEVTSKAVETLDAHILLAEDGPDNQRLISHVLRKSGAKVEIADNGQIAVDLALAAQRHGYPFDVILMDIQMPILDGYAACRELREQGYDRPIIALTANAMEGDRNKCLEAGMDDYTTKPIDRATLISKIAKAAAEGLTRTRLSCN